MGFEAFQRRFVNFFQGDVSVIILKEFNFSEIAFQWIHWCRIAFRLFLHGGGVLLLHFGSKATTWWSLNLRGCSWGCSVLNWILLLDWLDRLILAWVYCCPIEVWNVASWNTLFSYSSATCSISVIFFMSVTCTIEMLPL